MPYVATGPPKIHRLHLAQDNRTDPLYSWEHNTHFKRSHPVYLAAFCLLYDFLVRILSVRTRRSDYLWFGTQRNSPFMVSVHDTRLEVVSLGYTTTLLARCTRKRFFARVVISLESLSSKISAFSSSLVLR